MAKNTGASTSGDNPGDSRLGKLIANKKKRDAENAAKKAAAKKESEARYKARFEEAAARRAKKLGDPSPLPADEFDQLSERIDIDAGGRRQSTGTKRKVAAGAALGAAGTAALLTRTADDDEPPIDAVVPTPGLGQSRVQRVDPQSVLQPGVRLAANSAPATGTTQRTPVNVDQAATRRRLGQTNVLSNSVPEELNLGALPPEVAADAGTRGRLGGPSEQPVIGQTFGDPRDLVQEGTGVFQRTFSGRGPNGEPAGNILGQQVNGGDGRGPGPTVGLRRIGPADPPATATEAEEGGSNLDREAKGFRLGRNRNIFQALFDSGRIQGIRNRATAADNRDAEVLAATADSFIEGRKLDLEQQGLTQEASQFSAEQTNKALAGLADPDTANTWLARIYNDSANGNDGTGLGEPLLIQEIMQAITPGAQFPNIIDMARAALRNDVAFNFSNVDFDKEGNIYIDGKKSVAKITDLSAAGRSAFNGLIARRRNAANRQKRLGQ